ncbi:outer membrane beta-barrel protein [Flavisolibacter ginsenosidimutans]|uniref:PorT family protein n=1 Tax=Flavisolibacter ginsenosidimutans TaxID=661481 RepID=A0A5B8UKV1_9BACT|nr:outer membrane beta-barrel protein [Flavisolibacter ginsenosidimutans]QEC56650.1 PorT family protein [Flavisolibacter ginsenosidimutans]
MRFVNENTDDVFRQAGKDFPLNTDSADWDKVASVLYPNYSSQSQKSKSRRKHLWLLLLLPFSVVCNHYVENKLNYAEDESLPKAYAENKLIAKDLRSISKPAVEKTKIILAENEAVIANRNPTHFAKRIFSTSRNEGKNDKASLNTGSEKEESDVQERTKAEAIATLLQRIVTLRESKIFQRKNIAEGKAKEKVQPRSKRFSIGIEAGTGTTSVKFQRAKGLGFDLGLTAGYDLSKRLSIQAAVLSSKKNYYTNGAAFNTSKIYLPVNTKITSVEGRCRMLEIPIALRYNFSSSRKQEWFVAAGASSFLMKREDYDYEYFYANSGQSVKRSKTYKNSSKDWLAVAQFSGGYAYDVKGKFGLVAEPYIQVPLKGAGFGKLPLTSAGLRLSLVKKLF